MAASPTPADLLRFTQGEGLACEYQPIIDINSGAPHAHEALARFYAADGRRIPPLEVFRALHENPLSLFQVELQVKQQQLQHAPTNGRLFLNVDQDAFGVWEHHSTHPILSLFSQRKGTVLEIIENSDVVDAHLSEQMIHALKDHGVETALDDIGAPNSLVAMEVLAKVDYLKLDRSWFERMQDPDERALLDALLSFARATGKRTILEGVETQEQLAIATDLGLDFVRGYLFRSQFHHSPVSNLDGREACRAA